MQEYGVTSAIEIDYTESTLNRTHGVGSASAVRRILYAMSQ